MPVNAQINFNYILFRYFDEEFRGIAVGIISHEFRVQFPVGYCTTQAILNSMPHTVYVHFSPRFRFDI